MQPPSARILIFAKAPVAGKVKTRLAPLLGADGAAALAGEMLQITCAEALAVPHTRVELCAAPAPSHAEWQGSIPARVEVGDQGAGDLGARLARAAQRVIESGERVILIGSDCPALDCARLETAVRMLDQVDVFMHPTRDGGYALLALRRFSPLLFEGIAWSTAEVAAQTAQRVAQLGWRLAVGDTLRDIDEPEDWKAWKEQTAFGREF